MKIAFIIGSEFKFDEGSPSFRRMKSFKEGFEKQNYKVIIFSINQSETKNSIGYRYLFKTANKLINYFTWIFFLIKINKKYKNSLLLVSDLHNRYAITLPLFSKKLKTVIDIVEEPYAQFIDQNRSPFFKFYNPWHLKFSIKYIVRTLICYKYYWNFFSLRLTINNNLQHFVIKKTKNKKTIVCPIITSKKIIQVDPKERPTLFNYFIHVGGNSITKDGFDTLFKSFELFLKSNNNYCLVITGNISRKFKQLIDDFLLEEFSKDKIIFTGHLNDTLLYSYIKNSKACVISKNNNLLNRYNLSTRIIDYLQLSKVVILPTLSSHTNYFNSENSVLYNVNNYNDLTNKLNYVSRLSNKEIDIIGHKASFLLEHEFNVNHYCKNIIKHLY